MSKKKKFAAAFMAVVMLALIVLCVLFIKNKKNLTALIDAQKMSAEEIEQQIQENQKGLQKSLEEYNLPVIRDFTDEEEEKIINGEISPEQAVEIIMADSPDASDAPYQEDSSSGEADEKIGEKVAEIYSLKAYYLSKIGTLVQEAKSEYKSGTSVSQIIKSKMGEAVALEKECDEKVYSAIDEAEAAGADAEFIKTLKEAYEKEKGLKKSYYISQLK